MAKKYECSGQVTLRCYKGTAKREKCSACGCEVYVFEGQYGVFEWRKDGHYLREDAKRVYEVASAADRYARQHELVVRWIPA